MPAEYFEMLVRTLTLTPEERHLVIERRKERCICPQCPSYKECSGDTRERAFCSVERSKCIREEKGCICSTCPLTLELNLQHSSYCTRGSEAQQRILGALGIG